MGLLLAEQRSFDELRFDQDDWQIEDRRGQKTRHIEQHISKALAKLIRGDRRQIVTEVIPDLSIYRAQLINTHDLPSDICNEITRRAAVSGVKDELVIANGELAYYTEPAEHAPVPDDVRKTRVMKAVEHLHVAVQALADFHGVTDVEAAHLGRMRALMGPDAGALSR